MTRHRRQSTDSGARPTVPAGNAPDGQLNLLVDALVEALIVSDKVGSIERFNKAAEKLFGYSAAEVIGRNLSLLMPASEQQRHDRYLDRYLRTGERRIIGIGREVKAQRKDGTIFPAELAVGEVRFRDHIHFVGLMHDLTERKRAEEQVVRQGAELIKVSRLTTMGEMAAAMAHELNQPLTAISNYANASRRLLANVPEAADIVTALGQIDAQAHRASEVIRRMRSFVKYDDTRRESVRMTLMIEEIKPLLQLDATANNIRLEIRVAANLPELVADKVQIQQVILNLVRNGVDAMVDIAAAERLVQVSCERNSASEIRLDVSDGGTGVSPEAADRLFEAFYSTKVTGMGMGLAISRTIIEAHGGRLWFENNAAGGATFSFTLPTPVE